MAGLAVSHARGEADYAYGGGDAPEERGRLETILTTFYPYGRWRFTSGLELRGLLGAGFGQALHHPGGGGEPEGSDLTTWMGSVGLRRALAPAAGFDLAVRADASTARTRTASGPGEVAGLRADAWRGRLGLEASRRFALAEDATLTPFVEVAGRYDGGDGLAGSGLEIAGGARYASSGLEVEARGRYLAAHAEEDARERGFSLTVRLAPGADGQGFSLALAPRWGAPAGGADALWGEEMPRLSGGVEKAALDARVGYGIVWDSRGLLTPFAEASAGEESRLLRLGTRFEASRADLDVRLAGERRENGAGEPVHGVRLDVRLGF